MANRAIWVERIRQSLAGRYSYLRGHSSLVLDALPDSAKLLDFLSQLTIRKGDRKLLLALYFLNQPALKEFIGAEFPALLKAASRQTLLTRVERRGGGRGHIDWPTTKRLRLTSRQDPSFVVVRASDRTFVTPENQLLKYFLRLLDDLASYALAELASGSMHRDLSGLRSEVRLLSKHQYLRDVPSVNRATPLMKVRASRSRDRRYGVARTFVEQMEDVFHIGTWAAALKLVQVGYLAPIDDDDLFELFVLIQLLDVLETDHGFGPPASRGPIVGGRDAIATFRRGNQDESVAVYFDQSPSVFAKCGSEYVRVAKGYGITVASRRPDISLRHTANGVTTTLFVEMKKSDDKAYGRNSIYKGLGYLRDYSELWSPGEATKPKIAIVFPSPMKAASESPMSEDMWLVSAVEQKEISNVVGGFLSRV